MVESTEEGPHPAAVRQRILRISGALSIVSGVALCGWASLAGVRPGPLGFIVPIGVGFEAIFLGGLALAAGLPPGRRVAITRQPRVIAVAVLLSIVTLTFLTSEAKFLRPILEPIVGASQPTREGAALVIATLLALGLAAMVYGTLYTLGALGLAGIRWLAARLGVGRSP